MANDNVKNLLNPKAETTEEVIITDQNEKVSMTIADLESAVVDNPTHPISLVNKKLLADYAADKQTKIVMDKVDLQAIVENCEVETVVTGNVRKKKIGKKLVTAVPSKEVEETKKGK